MNQKNKFPDGQLNFQLDYTINQLPEGSSIQCNVELNTWDDFQNLIALKAKLNEKYDKIHLNIGYLFGSRSDRKFEDSGINYFRDVIAKIINDLNFTSVSVFDPHSLAVENAINNCIPIDPYDHINLHFIELLSSLPSSHRKDFEFVIAAPDLGAYKKVYGYFEKLSKAYKEINFNFISANKIRRLNGEITMTLNQPYQEFSKNKKQVLFLIDDICDGGRTFIEFAKLIDKSDYFIKDKYLYVSHGIFSKGVDELLNHFRQIYSTDSIYPSYIKFKGQGQVFFSNIFNKQNYV